MSADVKGDTVRHRCNKRLQTFFFKNVFKVYNSLNDFYFQQVKITEITFPNSSIIGNVLTINNNGIQRITVMEISIVVFCLFMVSPSETGVNLFTLACLTTKQNVYYERL